MSEIELNFNDGDKFTARPDNATLFTFAGAAALYDHVFLITDTEPIQGMYVFTTNSGYEGLKRTMLERGYPAHLNMLQAAECDVREWENHHLRDIREANGVPKGWE